MKITVKYEVLKGTVSGINFFYTMTFIYKGWKFVCRPKINRRTEQKCEVKNDDHKII